MTLQTRLKDVMLCSYNLAVCLASPIGLFLAFGE